jgi:hypothetical protein
LNLALAGSHQALMPPDGRFQFPMNARDHDERHVRGLEDNLWFDVDRWATPADLVVIRRLQGRRTRVASPAEAIFDRPSAGTP